MSRWLSPQKAARLAERAAMRAQRQRTEKRRSLMVIVGVAAVSVGLVVADYFWLRHQAKQKHERWHQHHQRSRVTNAPASNTPHIGQNQVTNHE